MNEHSVKHATFSIERVYATTPNRVFAAWSDPTKKASWFQQADEFDFQVGGRELNHGGPPGGPIYTFDAHYQEIVQDKRIVYTYSMDMTKTRISVSVVTVEMEATDSGTRLIFTEQGVFLDGHDTPEIREEGTNLMLDKLGEWLENEEPKSKGSNETIHTRIIDAQT
ncbi:polyketide cyclase [Paenibacillus psychroresistens]|uniref:Polyketide cyclase n=1 Tax=Paenibacillus psychroresistens TaxID=1778678 RepID=A0A6B8RNZ8_9BACL|nr:SRPBCC family protein [Paenibacillus psychroresistens]QGQ97524.1 polyketide cyclase [Paenibacillus psychroresistens]